MRAQAVKPVTVHQQAANARSVQPEPLVDRSFQMGQNFEAGKYYRYTVRLNKEELLLSGNEVADWNQEDLSDLVVTEEPAE